jgi:hypothetical protein
MKHNWYQGLSHQNNRCFNVLMEVRFSTQAAGVGATKICKSVMIRGGGVNDIEFYC